MQIHERYNLTKIINARGPYTPLGVSRSMDHVRRSVAGALGDFFLIEELQAAASAALSRITGAEAAAVTHCTSAAITLSAAAVMAGDSPENAAALPDTTGMANRVILPTGHAVNYGHPILQDIRLAGAQPVLAGTEQQCSLPDLESALEHKKAAALLLVSSRLVRGGEINFSKAVTSAHRRGIPVIIDGAAQDFRITELLATGADIVLVSAQKYLAAPTAGLVIGRKELVSAVRAQESGIGRGMKATKEGIIGVLAAIELRENLDLREWRGEQEKKAAGFVKAVRDFADIDASLEPDTTGLPFSRVCLRINTNETMLDARTIMYELRSGTPSIWVMEDRYDSKKLMLELLPLNEDEIQTILERMAAIFNNT